MFYFILFYFPDFREQCKADSVCCVVANLAKIAGCAAMYVCMYVCMYGDLQYLVVVWCGVLFYLVLTILNII